jgi:hypothetical protein
VARALRDVVPFDEPHVETAVRQTAEQRDIKAAPLIHATRVAVTGRTASPGLFEVLVLLGRERTVARWNSSPPFSRHKLKNLLSKLSRSVIRAGGEAAARDDVLQRLREKWAGKFRYG